MKQFLITVAGVIVGLVLFLVVAPIVVISMIASSMTNTPAAPQHMVLEIDLREPLTDQRPLSPFASWSGGQNVLDIVTRLHAAAEDGRVKGVYVRAAANGMAPAHAEEIRAALAAFQQSGKFVVGHIQNEGVRMSMAGYSAVAGADELWLQGVSEFMPMGLSSEQVFFGDTLRRYRLQPQFETREEFKSAADMLTQTGFTGPNRQQTQELLGSLYDIMLRHIAQDRGVSAQAARAAVESTPVTGQRAIELKLIDRLGQPEEAERSALARAGDEAELVSIGAYAPPIQGGGPTIAVVTGEGEILGGADDSGPFGDAQLMRGDAVARALLDASEDEDVRVILFRVSSPGGSVVASDQILAALRTARERGKRVVVSMGDVAASGGYYVAAEADEIVANPTTITGSIGVVGGKIVIGPALEHYLSARTDTIAVGSPLITMFSADAPFTPAGREAFASFIDRAYQEFMQRVAEGRDLTVAQVRDVARGRVWTGEQARQRGLVDHLGGFSTAVDRARVLADVKANERVQLKFFPAARTPLEELQQFFGASAESARAAMMLGAIVGDERVAAIIRAARENEAGLRARAEGVTVR
ncbi:MAG: S49 family peptidase [Hyphomonadaceae bacterium]